MIPHFPKSFVLIAVETMCYFCTALGVLLTFLFSPRLETKTESTRCQDPLLAPRLTPQPLTDRTMPDLQSLTHAVAENWPIWVVTITLIVAAVIDGMKLKVPNWITFPMIISGWIYSAFLSPYAGWEGLLFSLGGTVVGLAAVDASLRDWRHGCGRREVDGWRRRLGVGDCHAVGLRHFGDRRWCDCRW